MAPKTLRPSRRFFVPVVEPLEERSLLNASAAAVKTISGVATVSPSGQVLANVQVELINSKGQVAQTTRTDATGHFHFSVRGSAPYVLHAVAPGGMTQVTPTFPNVEPQGALNPGRSTASWNYTSLNTNPSNGPVGPRAWATIAPEGNYPFQAPINLTGPTVDLSKYVQVHYTDVVPTQLINNGRQLQVQVAAAPLDTVSVAGQPYYLTQFHYHAPAENVVGGKAYTLEEHFVNVSPNGAETVVAVFLKLGKHNNAFDAILSGANPGLIGSGTKGTITGTVHFADLLPRSTQGWFYTGSLTTPPLSAPVNWFVYAKPITLDATQLNTYLNIAYSSSFFPNARPVQPMNGRVLNEFNYNVNLQGTSVANMNFSFSAARA